MQCYYCGISSTETRIVRDHFIPKAKGGPNSRDNLVPACDGCNRTKTDLMFTEAREKLVLRRLGWPAFNAKQMEWLRANGLDTSPLDNAKLYFEERECERALPGRIRRPRSVKPQRRSALRQYLRNQAFYEASRHLLDLGLPKHMRRVLWGRRGDRLVRSEIPSHQTNS